MLSKLNFCLRSVSKLIVALCQKVIDPGTGVLETQRKLAEIVEMIHTAQVLNSDV